MQAVLHKLSGGELLRCNVPNNLLIMIVFETHDRHVWTRLDNLDLLSKIVEVDRVGLCVNRRRST